MLRLLDLLFIAFIYVNLLTSKLSLGGLPVSKALIGLCLLISFVYSVVNPAPIRKRALFYIFTSFLLILILATIGAIKGNKPANIMAFISPLSFLLLIPALTTLISKYGIERYLRHMLRATLLLSVFVIVVYAISEWLGQKGLVILIARAWENLTVLFIGDTTRISVKTSIFLPAGLCALLLQARRGVRLSQVMGFVLICTAVYMTKTLGVWAGTFMALCVYYFTCGKMSMRRALLSLAMIVFVVASGIILYRAIIGGDAEVSGGKDVSIYTKEQQVQNAMDLFQGNPILGKGLGYEYTAMDWRETKDIYLEVFYAMLLSSVGLLGTFFYVFILMYYPIKYLFHRSSYPVEASVLLASFMAIITASAANPYIWSGGVGLFFPALLAALMDSDFDGERRLGLAPCPVTAG